MLEILQFIFSSFWIWFGFSITLIGACGALRGNGFIKTYYKGTKSENKQDKS